MVSIGINLGALSRNYLCIIMDKIKLKSGREIGIKDISLDERDEMLDSVEYVYDDKGGVYWCYHGYNSILCWCCW